MNEFVPAYLRLPAGELERRMQLALARLNDCELCPRRCRVDRARGVLGACRTSRRARLASAFAHFGEESPLVGRGGSGTLFFAGCNLYCVFCQNWDISHGGSGQEVEAEELAAAMLQLQREGCCNINLVTPSHVVPQILEALVLAAAKGLRLPLVYNTGGYDSLPTLQLLDGVVDIYLPDLKFADSKVAARYLAVADYAEVARAAVREMHRQVGELELDRRGIARRGLLVRHLVLPAGLAGTAEALRFLAQEIAPNSAVNVMGQYRPCFHAPEYPPLDRRPTAAELAQARALARALGLRLID